MMNKVIFVFIMGIFAAACGGNAASNSAAASRPAASAVSAIEVKVKDKTTKLEAKSSVLYSDDWTINMPDGKAVPTAVREIVIANYDLDTSFGKSTSSKKLTSPEQMRIVIGLEDKANVKKDQPISTGEYGPKMDEFSKILNIQIYTFADGGEVKTTISGGNSDNKGSIKITGINGDSVTGEIDLSNTDNSIKGSFLAKIWKPAAK